MYLRGLDPRAVYSVEAIDQDILDKQTEFSGAYLMQNGLNLTLKGDFDSTAVLLHRTR
jgi:alpha-galactosidase